MRIGEKKTARSSGTGTTTPQRSGKVGASLFAGALRRTEREIADYRLELEELQHEIDSVGEELDKDPTMARFRRFRDLIAALVKKVTGGAYKVEVVGGAAHDTRTHELVTIIDREADALLHLIMARQKDRLAITDRIVKLKGLVVDLLT